jgi:Ca-activated chloride channel family protein
MTRRGPSALVAVALAALVGGLMLAACDSSSRTPDPNDPNTLTVLAGSEVKDIEPLLPDLQKATGVSLAMKYSGTLEGAEAIAGGAATDIAWFSSGHYL